MEAQSGVKRAQQLVHQLDVACAELKSLPPTRPVYQKRGSLFFKSNAEKAMSSQQKELDKARKALKKS
ncbi:unnamed protein product [Calypogeia fissa]